MISDMSTSIRSWTFRTSKGKGVQQWPRQQSAYMHGRDQYHLAITSHTLWPYTCTKLPLSGLTCMPVSIVTNFCRVRAPAVTSETRGNLLEATEVDFRQCQGELGRVQTACETGLQAVTPLAQAGACKQHSKSHSDCDARSTNKPAFTQELATILPPSHGDACTSK
jgi:hypothetical protein